MRSGAVIAGPRAGSSTSPGVGDGVCDPALLSGVDGRGEGWVARGEGAADGGGGVGDAGVVAGWVGGGGAGWVGDEAGVGSTVGSAESGGSGEVGAGSALSGDAITIAAETEALGGAPYPGGAASNGANTTAAAANVAAHQAMTRPADDMVRSPRSPARAHVREGVYLEA